MISDPAQYMQEHFQDLGDLESDFRNKNLNDLIVSKLRGKSLLDVGCGVGHILNSAEKKGFEVHGAEPDEKLIEISKQIYKKDFHIKPLGYQDLPTLNQTFDNVIMIDVLEHIEDDEGALKTLSQSVSDNGQLIIAVPANQFLYGPRDKAIGHYRRYSREELRDKITRQGFTVKHIQYWNMMGFFVYFFYSKIVQKQSIMELRKNKKRGPLMNLLNKFLHIWVKYVENNLNLGFGLSLICVAKPYRKKRVQG